MGREDVSVVTVILVDSLGREIPAAGTLIHFDAEAGYEIIGVGNGDPRSDELDKYPDGKYRRKLFNGKGAVIIMSERKPGDITLRATRDGPKAETIKIATEPSKLVPSLRVRRAGV